MNIVAHFSNGTTVLELKRRKGPFLYCVIDSKDYPLVSAHLWHAVVTKKIIYARTWLPGQKSLYMHQLLVPDVEEVDHKDHDGLNNRRSNLRPATEIQNKQNRRKAPGKSSSYRGVSFEAKSWRVKIMANGKSKHIGCFQNEIEAAKAYDAAAKQLHGAFATLNFQEDINASSKS